MPNPGFVEIDPEELWETLLDVIYNAVIGNFMLKLLKNIGLIYSNLICILSV